MKSHITRLLLIGILGITPFCYAQTDSNTSFNDVKKETQDLLETIGSYSVDKKDEALKKARESLNDLDQRIDALETKVDKNWSEMSDASREQARESLRALRKQRNEVAQWYGSMMTSSASAWEHMKKGFSDAYMSLEDAWEKSEKEFSNKN